VNLPGSLAGSLRDPARIQELSIYIVSARLLATALKGIVETPAEITLMTVHMNCDWGGQRLTLPMEKQACTVAT
jgi:hypothetical protein